MPYRTRIYIAADWDGDNNLVSTLQEWNESEYWDLSFPDAHELTQARDASKACSIKKSLYTRLERSKTFVLIVGKQTASLRKELPVLSELYGMVPQRKHRQHEELH